MDWYINTMDSVDEQLRKPTCILAVGRNMAGILMNTRSFFPLSMLCGTANCYS